MAVEQQQVKSEWEQSETLNSKTSQDDLEMN